MNQCMIRQIYYCLMRDIGMYLSTFVSNSSSNYLYLQCSILEKNLANSPAFSSTSSNTLSVSSNIDSSNSSTSGTDSISGTGSTDRGAGFMWGLWRCEDELTLLVEGALDIHITTNTLS
jgi:hypothetical protein